jgi:hypothetical protein
MASIMSSILLHYGDRLEHSVRLQNWIRTSNLQSIAWSFIDLGSFDCYPSPYFPRLPYSRHPLSSTDDSKEQTKMPFTIKAIVTLIALSTVITAFPTNPTNNSTHLTPTDADTTTEDANRCKLNGESCLSKWECCVSQSIPVFKRPPDNLRLAAASRHSLVHLNRSRLLVWRDTVTLTSRLVGRRSSVPCNLLV